MFDKTIKEQKKAKKKATKEKADLDKAQDLRCFPIVEKYYQLLADNELTLGKTEFEEKEKYVNPIVGGLLEECLARNLKVGELKYVDQLIKKVNGDIMETLFNSINRSLNICSKDYWGVDDVDKDFKLIDEKLTEIADKQKS